MKYFSMFSGIGGFEHGIEKAFESYRQQQERSKVGRSGDCVSSKKDKSDQSEKRWNDSCECVGFSEIDKYAIAIYKHHYKEHQNYGDATRIIPESIPDFDLLVGGFPCQAFSIAGKRLGFNETRGTLFFDIARVLAVKKPRNFVLENVKGLLSHDDGRTFKTIISTLVELGYDVEWQVLNSKNHGVPQNRERVFIVGHLGGFGGREIFPFGESGAVPAGADGADSGRTQAEVSHTLRGSNVKADQVFIAEGPTRRLDAENRAFCTMEYSATLAAKGSKNSSKTGMYRDHNLLVDHRIRRLTPTECERLQAFPDGWTKEGIDGPVSDSQRYKTLGNSVTTSVIEAIMEKLYA